MREAMSDPWHAFMWMWEAIAMAYVREATQRGEVTGYDLGYHQLPERWKATLLGSEHWTPPRHVADWPPNVEHRKRLAALRAARPTEGNAP